MGRIANAFARLTADEHQLHSEQLQDDAVELGATAVSACQLGLPVCVAGTLRSVVLRPRAGTPSLEAELWDGTGTVTLIWLGRRRIGGVDPGRALVARGRLTKHDGRPTLYNPAYELRPTGA